MPFSAMLNRLQDERALVDVRRDGLDVSDIRGFIVGVSEALVLIAVVGDSIERDGFTIVERSAITFLRWGEPRLVAWAWVVELDRHELAAFPQDLTDWRSTIASPRPSRLLTFHREAIDRSTAYVAREFEVMGDLLVGKQVTPDGEEQGAFAIKLEDLTRVDFGGSYERGLSRILESSPTA